MKLSKEETKQMRPTLDQIDAKAGELVELLEDKRNKNCLFGSGV